MDRKIILKKGKVKKRGRKHRSGKGPGRGRNFSVRVLAVKILVQWFSARSMRRTEIEELISRTLGEDAGRLQRGDARDLSLCREIVLGVVRWQRLLEWHIRRYARKFAKLPIEVQAVLYAGAFQVIFLTRIPYFAAVDESVKAVDLLGSGWAKGLVNAVLRKLAGSNHLIPDSPGFFLTRCKGENFSTCISRFSSHPTWMVRRWVEFHGKERAAEICFHNNQRAPLTLRVNLLSAPGVEQAVGRLQEAGIDVRKGLLVPEALELPGFRGNPAFIPGLEDGWFQVQDQAAQLVVRLSGIRPGMKVLDLCAGVGGKTSHLAALMENRGVLYGFDTSASRLKTLQENCSRLGVRCLQVLRSRDELEALLDKGDLDLVLVDAPCSGLGVIRRHPDIKWNRRTEDIYSLSLLQREIVAQGIRGLRPGGRLLYSVCTLEPEETLEQVSCFIRSHGLELIDISTLFDGRELPPEGAGLLQDLTEQGCLRIWPGTINMDGFFAAMFRSDTLC